MLFSASLCAFFSLFSASPCAFFSHGSIKKWSFLACFRNCPSGWTFWSQWWLALHFDIHGALAKCCYRCGCQMRATIQELWGLQLYGIRLVRSSLFQWLTSKLLLRGAIRLWRTAKTWFLFVVKIYAFWSWNIVKLIWCYFLMTIDITCYLLILLFKNNIFSL